MFDKVIGVLNAQGSKLGERETQAAWICILVGVGKLLGWVPSDASVEQISGELMVLAGTLGLMTSRTVLKAKKL